MKYLLLAVTFLFIGCSEPPTQAELARAEVAKKHRKMYKGLDIICLNSVKYWSGARSIALYIDPTTMQPERCDE